MDHQEPARDSNHANPFRMIPRVVHPITVEEYRNSEGVNQSVLHEFRYSPLHVYHALTTKSSPPTDQQTLGLVVESMVLKTPFLYTTSPFDSYRSKEAQAWKEQQIEQGVAILSQEKLETAKRIAESVMRSKAVAPLLAHGKSQVACFAPWNKVMRKGLIDRAPDDIMALIDLKTTARGASKDDFARRIWEFSYHVQAAYYVDLWSATHPNETEPRQFVFIAVETDPPYGVGVYALDNASIQLGRATYSRWLDRFEECASNDQWPGYGGDDIEFIELPGWAQKKPVE